MPIGHDSWNPYRLVPIRSAPPQGLEPRPAGDLERYAGERGSLKVDLRTVTPLYIGGGGGSQSFVQSRGRPVIPATSLKGMLRSLCEAIVGGCDPLEKRASSEAGNRACDPGRELCAACRLFGALSDRSAQKGRVFLGDGVLKDESWTKLETRAVGLRPFRLSSGSPKKSHKAFYPTAKVARRKVYHHRPAAIQEADGGSNITNETQIRRIKALPAGMNFEFELSWENLRREELGLLLYAVYLDGNEKYRARFLDGDRTIELKGPLCQRIGQGKGYGLGTVILRPRELNQIGPEREGLKLRVRSLSGDAMLREIQNRCRFLSEDPALNPLRAMMVFDASDPRRIEYPSWDWFRKQGNSQVALRSFIGGERIR